MNFHKFQIVFDALTAYSIVVIGVYLFIRHGRGDK